MAGAVAALMLSAGFSLDTSASIFVGAASVGLISTGAASDDPQLVCHWRPFLRMKRFHRA